MLAKRPNRLVAFVALFALLLASTAFLAHGHLEGGKKQHSELRCDLCLQFSGGTAGPLQHPVVVVQHGLVVRAPRVQSHQVHLALRKTGSQQPRAPPVLNVI